MKGEDHHDSFIRQKIIIKDRPFAEGSRGCHALSGLDAQNLNAKERTSLYIATCDMDLYYAVRRFYFFHITRSYKAYFLHTNQSYIFREQFLLLAPMTTYLKDLTQPIARYGGLSWQYWFKGCLEAQVVSLLSAKILASMRGEGKLNMLDDP